MPLIKVRDEEWAEAEAYFKSHQSDNKFSKKKLPGYRRGDQYRSSFHSFIKADDGQIYAMENGKYLGEGGFGKVKIAQNKKGENFAIKIEKLFSIKKEERALSEELRTIGYEKGKANRIFEQPKRIQIEKQERDLMGKSYTIMKLMEGKDLDKCLDEDGSKLTRTQKLIIALKSAQAIQNIHSLGLIHRDIKPQNFVVSIKGNNIKIEAVDYDFAVKIPRGASIVEAEPLGTPGYVAKEINYGIAIARAGRKDIDQNPVKGKFSVKSDVYALGAMFADVFGEDLEKNKELARISHDMQKHDPNSRPDLEAVIQSLKVELKKQYEPELNGELYNLTIKQIANKEVPALGEDERQLLYDYCKFSKKPAPSVLIQPITKGIRGKIDLIDTLKKAKEYADSGIIVNFAPDVNKVIQEMTLRVKKNQKSHSKLSSNDQLCINIVKMIVKTRESIRQEISKQLPYETSKPPQSLLLSGGARRSSDSPVAAPEQSEILDRSAIAKPKRP